MKPFTDEQLLSHLQFALTPEYPLDATESFTQWLDSRGDSLAAPDSFEEWLKQREDEI